MYSNPYSLFTYIRKACAIIPFRASRSLVLPFLSGRSLGQSSRGFVRAPLRLLVPRLLTPRQPRWVFGGLSGEFKLPPWVNSWRKTIPGFLAPVAALNFQKWEG